jgi:hypothetical protein
MKPNVTLNNIEKQKDKLSKKNSRLFSLENVGQGLASIKIVIFVLWSTEILGRVIFCYRGAAEVANSNNES